MRTGRYLFAAVVLAGASAASAATTGTATCAVDFTESGAMRFTAPASIRYAPALADETATADSCDLLLVTHVGQEQCATQTLVSAASAAGVHSLGLPADGSRTIRLVLRARSGGSVVGELVKDVSLAAVSPSSAEGYYDTGDSKIDRLLASGGTPQLVYSDTWTNGVASLYIDHVDYKLRTRTLFSAATPADGEYVFNPFGRKNRTHTCRLHFRDALGDEIGEPLTASYTGITESCFTLSFK